MGWNVARRGYQLNVHRESLEGRVGDSPRLGEWGSALIRHREEYKMELMSMEYYTTFEDPVPVRVWEG